MKEDKHHKDPKNKHKEDIDMDLDANMDLQSKLKSMLEAELEAKAKAKAEADAEAEAEAEAESEAGAEIRSAGFAVNRRWKKLRRQKRSSRRSGHSRNLCNRQQKCR